MARAPYKTCPGLFRLAELAHPGDILSFLRQDEFQREKWLKKYLPEDGDELASGTLDQMLQQEKKSRLDPLEREASRILKVIEPRGQFALEGLVKSRMRPSEQAEFGRAKDQYCRSLWAYLNHRLIFEAVESEIHRRLYRTYAKHYKSYPVVQANNVDPAQRDSAIASFIEDIQIRLDKGDGCRVERFDIPVGLEEPAAEMYIIYHPNALASAREINEEGERRTIYFRPPGEATVIYTPSTGVAEIRADTQLIREEVAESFACTLLDGQLSKEPLGSREYDLSRFLEGLELDCPELSGFQVKSARVLKADICVGSLANRLSLSTTKQHQLDDLIDQIPGMRNAFRNAVAMRFVDIFVEYTMSGDAEPRTLDFTISDQNTCSLQSLAEEHERVLGHRLLKRWGILREFRRLTDAEAKATVPVLLELWNSGLCEVSGSWIGTRGLDETILTSTGFLTPVGWEDVELVEEDAIQWDAQIVVEGSRALQVLTRGTQTDGGDGLHYRRFKVDQGWLIQHLRDVLPDALDEVFVESLSPDLHALGTLQVDDGSVPVYLARNLSDPRVLAASDQLIRARSDRGTGLVLSAAQEPFRCLASNILAPLVDLIGTDIDLKTMSRETLVQAFRNNRVLAEGGRAVELVWDGGDIGELFVPGKGTVQIKGKSRLIAVEKLVKAYRSGVKAVKTRTLTEHCPGTQFRNVFGAPLWQTLEHTFIRSAGRGAWEIAA